MTRLAFVDTETTGLDPDLHEVWEVGLIVRGHGVDAEYLWHLPVDLAKADPIALNIGRFHQRNELVDQRYLDVGETADEVARLMSPQVKGEDEPPYNMAIWADDFAHLTRGAHLVGAVVSFDEERLRKLLRANGQCPMWHYHLVDVEALAAGWIAGAHVMAQDAARPPWSSAELSRAVGVEPDEFDRHTALGDARWARAIYDALMAE